MNRQTEDRLRAAFDAKAEQVTDERLDRLADERRRLLVADLDGADGSDGFPTIPGLTDPDPAGSDSFGPREQVTRIEHPASPRHARWLAPVLAAAAVIAMAVGVTAVSNSVNDGKRTANPPATQISTPTPTQSPTPTPTPSLTPTPSSTPSQEPTADRGRPSATATPPVQAAPLGHGQQADRSQIPWSQVGPGWTLALWTPSTKIEPGGERHARVLRTATESLFLINPVGGRYLIMTLPVKSELTLVDWSGDGRRALFHGPGTSRELSVLDLQNGTVNKLAGVNDSESQFTRPLGKAVLSRSGSFYERVDLNGATQLKFPAEPADFQGRTSVGRPLYTEDGSQFVIATSVKAKSDARVMVIGNDGRFIRALPGPVGYDYCSPRRWWTADLVLAFCQPTGGVIHRLFLMPLSGDPATELAAELQNRGYFDAVKVGSSTVLHRSSLRAECGDEDLARLQQDGTGTDLNLAARFGGTNSWLLGAAKNRVQFLVRTNCVNAVALVSYGPATGESTVLLGGPVNGGSILGARSYRATDPPS